MRWENCCRGRQTACPQVCVEGHDVWIRDEEKHQIHMTLGEFTDLHWKIKEIVSRDIPRTKRAAI